MGEEVSGVGRFIAWGKAKVYRLNAKVKKRERVGVSVAGFGLAFQVVKSYTGFNNLNPPSKTMLHILWSIIVGFIIGLIARAIMPGAQHMGFMLTTIVGIVGSIVGGFIGRLISKPKEGQPVHPAGLIMSVIGALIVLFVWGKIGM